MCGILQTTLARAAQIVPQSGSKKAKDGVCRSSTASTSLKSLASTKGKSRRNTPEERELLKRRQPIESIIGYLKEDHRIGRCHLKGESGDRLHAVLCAAGYNIKWLLRMIAHKGVVAFLKQLFFAPACSIALCRRPDRMARNHPYSSYMASAKPAVRGLK